MTDPMKQLRAADPARRANLDAVDDAAFAALREEITMTSTDDPAAAALPDAALPRRRRLGRRGAVAIGLAAVLTGGGVAYAALQSFQGSSGEGVTCVDAWDQDAKEGLNIEAAGPWLTGDPYADCTTMLAEQGLPPIEDPVAFAYDGQTIVAPADQVPDDAERLEGSTAVDAGAVELGSSASDLVDGGMAECRTVAEGITWAQSEFDRLGLEGWSAGEPDPATQESYPPVPGEPEPLCSELVVNVGDHRVDVYEAFDPADFLENPETHAIVTTLREQIVAECLSLDEARVVVDEAFTAIDHEFPTTYVEDESAECAHVDVAVGGSIQATVYGPTQAG